jgi:hypothetical protein
MNKSRIALACIGIFAAIGGALAFNVRATTGYITVNGSTIPTSTTLNCTYLNTGCTVLYQGRAYQLYTFDGSIYRSVATLPAL